MIKHIRTIVFTLVALNTSIVKSQNLSFDYRGIFIGQSYEDASKRAQSEFGNVNLSNLSKEVFEVLGMKELISGDSTGLKNQNCGYGENIDCLAIKISTSHKNLGEKVFLIKVQQSFKHSASAESLLNGLKEKYGAPRLFFSSGLSKKFIWGGLNTPANNYSPSASIEKDVQAIGGKFISAIFFLEKDKVPGYHLSIIDSEIQKLNGAELQKVTQEILKDGSKQNKIKF